MTSPRLLGFLLLALSNAISGTDGYYYYRWRQCLASSKDLSDMVSIDAFYFNKIKYTVFNSTVGRFVGYSDYGVRNAEFWNNNTAYLNGERADVDGYCKHNAGLFINNVLDKTVQPYVSLSLGRTHSGSHPAMLVCSAYDFYPKMIKLTWYRDDKEVTGDVTSTEEMADGDWYYQIHSHLEFTPKAGEKISCVVEHTSFNEPKEFVWDSSMPEAEKNKVAIGAAGLVLGLVVCAAGLLYYRKKSQGWILVPPR